MNEEPAPQNPLGGLDLGALMGAAAEMKSSMDANQARVAETEVTGKAAGGDVAITVTGDMDFKSVTIAGSVIDPDDTELLEDLVLAALRDAASQIATLQAQADPMAGLDLGALGGLLGGGDG